MICLICRKADAIEGSTLIEFERGEFRLIVTGVPARVCPNCGEAYLDESTAERLLRFARQTFHDGILDTRSDFGAL
jgi:YgiT-type zinc finger domain-containing protein